MVRIILVLAALAAPLGLGASQARADHVGVVVAVAPPAPRNIVPEVRYGYDSWDSYDGYSYGGYVWVQGRWSWNGHDWAWIDGYWTEARPGHVWADGYWASRGHNHWYWTEGSWQPIGMPLSMTDVKSLLERAASLTKPAIR